MLRELLCVILLIIMEDGTPCDLFAACANAPRITLSNLSQKPTCGETPCLFFPVCANAPRITPASYEDSAHERNMSPRHGVAKRRVKTSDVLPNDMHDQDQGPVCTAGIAYLNGAGDYLVIGKWGRIHRLCNDIKHALRHSGAGIFYKAHMYSTYLWSVGNKPYNTKAVTPQKRRILNVFLATEKQSKLFRKYCEKIAEDMGMSCQTPDEETHIFNSLSCLKSLKTARHRPKNSLWSFKHPDLVVGFRGRLRTKTFLNIEHPKCFTSITWATSKIQTRSTLLGGIRHVAAVSQNHVHHFSQLLVFLYMADHTCQNTTAGDKVYVAICITHISRNPPSGHSA